MNNIILLSTSILLMSSCQDLFQSEDNSGNPPGYNPTDTQQTVNKDDCNWELTHIEQDVFRIGLADESKCSELALEVIPTIDFGDGTTALEVEQDYITHTLQLVSFDSNIDYQVTISSNSELVNDTQTTFPNIYENIASCDQAPNQSLIPWGDSFTKSGNPGVFLVSSQNASCDHSPEVKTAYVDFGDGSEVFNLPTSQVWHIFPEDNNYTISAFGQSRTIPVNEINNNIGVIAKFNSCQASAPIISVTHQPTQDAKDNMHREFSATISSMTPDGCTYWSEREMKVNFGDGAQVNASGKLEHQFISEGVYPVSVKGASEYANVTRTILYNANKFTPEFQEPVCEILAPPSKLKFLVNNIANQSIEIDRSQMVYQARNPCESEHTIMTAVWNFGDGTIIESNDSNLTYQYSQAGVYNVSVKFGYVEDNITIEQVVTVR